MVTLVCEVEEDRRPAIAFTVDPNSGSGDPLGFKKLLDLEYFRSGQMEKMSGRSRYNPNYKKGWEAYKRQVQEGEVLMSINEKILQSAQIRSFVCLPKNINILIERS